MPMPAGPRPSHAEHALARAIATIVKLAAYALYASALPRIYRGLIGIEPLDAQGPVDALTTLYFVAFTVFLAFRWGFPLLAWFLWALGKPADAEGLGADHFLSERGGGGSFLGGGGGAGVGPR